ncbi:MAG: ATP-binding protein, partial [Lachnospiraceae bacterium]|nr:ATP-binding protein [Lachnospiraceae bacterium]
MFIGRERELEALNRLYQSEKFEFAVIYGRRRVGNPALINQFSLDIKARYLRGGERPARQDLENFSKSILEYSVNDQLETSFASFQAALEYVFRLAEKERLILVIDEFPYVAQASKSLA